MLRRNLFLAIALGVVLVGSLANALLARPAKPSPASTRPEVSTTLFPLYDIVRNVAGDAVEVGLILPPGASPHTFEPRPSDVRDVDQSSVVYAFGHGIDGWASVIAESTGTPVVTVDANVPLIPFQEAHEEDDAEHAHEESTDPHYWLSPRNAMQITRNVAADLSTRYPADAKEFAANADRYAAELEKLNGEIHASLADLPNRNLVTLHDAWGYFAAEYGLTIAGSFEPAPGKEPTPAWLSELGKTVAAAKVRALYAEPQLSNEGLESFAKDHRLRIVTIDPEGSDATDSYIDMLRSNAHAIRDNQ